MPFNRDVHIVGLMLIATATGCGGDGQSARVPDAIGVFEAEGYGLVLDVGPRQLRVYELTSDACLLSDELGISALEAWTLSDDGSELRQRQSYGSVELRSPRFERRAALPERCAQSALTLRGRRGYRRDAERDFELFWRTFQELYAGFDARGVDWRAQYEALRDQVTADMSDAALFDVLLELIAPLADSHVSIEGPDGEAHNFTRGTTVVDRIVGEFLGTHGPVTTEEDYAALEAYYLEQIEALHSARRSYAPTPDAWRCAASELVCWYRRDDGIGVLVVDAMFGFSGATLDDLDFIADLEALDAALDAAWSTLGESRGIIVDVRNNGGGFDAAGQLIAGRFLREPLEAYGKHARLGEGFTPLEMVTVMPHPGGGYDGPVALLTSTSTTSAAEVFALTLRNLEQVTIIGEPTQGAFSDVLDRQLPNGFAFTLANELYREPSGVSFEGSGVPVDIEVAHGTLAERSEGRDLGMESALEWLGQ